MLPPVPGTRHRNFSKTLHFLRIRIWEARRGARGRGLHGALLLELRERLQRGADVLRVTEEFVMRTLDEPV